MSDTMLVRRGDVVHVRGCDRTAGAKVTPVYSTGPGMQFCTLCGAEPRPKVAAGSLGSSVVGKTVAVPPAGLDEAFTGRVLSVAHEGGATGRTITSFLFEPAEALGRARSLTVDSSVRVEVRS
ncbi:hypothetical protein [Curtobacterium sp. MCBD17_028]|uniref:hypothetical protein n=1 Tax=Curtobacterium sp. MCBD17_028 TaxID=2175670 RepID=UPI000DA8B4A2|nr:hypothetical protein [Curtobacterium sp. MCBD17_028]PZE23884.1 hypothetical protein DEI86_13655 [Curtobacterium sp. MCBD17_028]